MFCAPTHDEAVRIAAPYLKGMYDAYVTWGQDKAMAADDRDISMEYEELARDRFMPQTQVLETFDLMAKEVFPKVRAAL